MAYTRPSMCSLLPLLPCWCGQSCQALNKMHWCGRTPATATTSSPVAREPEFYDLDLRHPTKLLLEALCPVDTLSWTQNLSPQLSPSHRYLYLSHHHYLYKSLALSRHHLYHLYKALSQLSPSPYLYLTSALHHPCVYIYLSLGHHLSLALPLIHLSIFLASLFPSLVASCPLWGEHLCCVWLIPPHHYIPFYHRPNTGPDDHGMKPLRLWIKVKPSPVCIN